MSDNVKPRIRVPAKIGISGPVTTTDNFFNVVANLGYGTFNVSSGGTYGFNPITRNRTLLEWSYRGSWLIRKIVDCPADDMTREGIEITGDEAPDDIEEFMQSWNSMQIWQRINDTLKWSRLYGGCLAVIMVEGQRLDTPLRLDTVGVGQFKGLMVLDRWMVTPAAETVTSYGEDHGRPMYYQIVTVNSEHANERVHHSRCIRFDGIGLPYWQQMAENGWGLSIIEPIWDRLLAFDSATQGAAQLVYKAHLRVLKLPQYRELVATGGPLFAAVMKQLQMIRMMQTNEGLTVIDAEDTFEANSYAFGGLTELLTQFGQQVSGAADVPMTRLYGQSPAGMNSTGESDLRNYYDALKSQQEFRLRRPVKLLLDINHRSLYGKPIPRGFNFTFNPLWQLTEESKAGIATQIAQATDGLLQSGIFTPAIALKEIRQQSTMTGFGTNITDEDIEAAEEAPPPGAEAMQGPDGEPSPDYQGQGAPAANENEAAEPQVQGPEQGQGIVNASEGPQNEAPVTIPVHSGIGSPLPPPVQPDEKHMDLLMGYARRIIEKRGGGRLRVREHDQAMPIEQPNQALARARRRYPGLMTHVNVGGARINIGDRQSMTEVCGIPCVIETAKGESRQGKGWQVTMPCHYGYIQGTNSSEGRHEQFDAFIGPNRNAKRMWLIEQIDPNSMRFDEYKAMLGYGSKDEALADYRAAFDDNGDGRIGEVREMGVEQFKDFLKGWKYGDKPKRGNGYDHDSLMR